MPRFNTKKWIEIHDQSGGICNINKQIRSKTSMLRSESCEYSDAYIVAKGTMNVTDRNNNAYPPSMRVRSNVSFRYHIGQDLADHAEMSS